MEIELNEQIISEINDLNIKSDLKKDLLYFNRKLRDTLKINKDNQIRFDVIIDNRSKKDIDILLEYIVNILEKYGLYKEYIKYKNTTNIQKITNSVIIIDDFEIFNQNILDDYYKERNVSNFFKNIRVNNNIVIITSPNSIDKILKNKIPKILDLDLCIHLNKIQNKKELYSKLLNKYQENNINYKLSYKTFLKIINSLEDNNYVKNFDIDEYIYNYSIKKMILNDSNIINHKTFNNIIEKTEESSKNNKQQKNKNQIENLIGLSNIKKELNYLYNYLDFSKNIINQDSMYLNLFFLGNPGTGKTTVARMYANKLYELGYIKENKLIEAIPTDFMGEFVGQTRETTRKILTKAKNGVLFIDEAYLLHTNSYKFGKNPFMEEAVVELIKYLEEPQNVVIFAGYPDEMRKLYQANPGIKSRIYGEILFEDYTKEELYQILNQDLTKKGLNINPKSKQKIINYIEYLKDDNNFGNARTIKQLSQKMIMNHASRKQEKNNLLLDEFDLPKKENKKTSKLGFGIYN